MKCAVHTEVDATGYCRNCGKPMCSACARPVRDVLYCEDCLATVMGHAPAPAPAPLTAPAGATSYAAAPTSSASTYATPSASTTQPYPAPPGAPYQVRQAGSSSPTIAFILGLFPGLGAI